ncbi:MAG: SpoIIE family protein phosphatase [Oscillospiraceae bacterium]|nr:SpoIIE family protein phosphatase [Oscillospiraceae bacterium]
METPERKGSLKRKINLEELLLMILMAIIISIVSYFAMNNTFLRFYNEKGLDIVRTLAAEVDGDRLEECLKAENVTEQPYYQDLQRLFDVTKSNITDHTYLYMFIPGEDSWVYVVEGHAPGDDPEWLSSYGDVYKYGETEYTRMLPDAKAKKPSTEIVLGGDVGYGRSMSNWAPVLNSKGDLVTMVEIDYSLEAIEGQLRDYITKLILAFVVCIAGVLLIVLQIIRRRVTTPLENLTDFVDSYEHGKLNEEMIADFKSGDEIQWLATAFRDMTVRMETYIRDLTKVTAEKERIGAELNVATQIQADMLPRIFPAFPERPEFDLYASMSPAKEVGGDFYDFFLIDDNHLGLVMADVSGKGVPAALFMVIAKTLIKNRAQLGESPAEILNHVNEQLCEGNEAELFVTVWLAVLEISTGRGLAANAGHEHPVIRRANGDYELVVYRHSPAVATMEGLRFKEHSFELYPGDSLFVYTDGVPEATNANSEMFGTDRMLEALNQDPDASPEQILKNVRAAVDGFVQDAEQFDDLTMLGLKYNG